MPQVKREYEAYRDGNIRKVNRDLGKKKITVNKVEELRANKERLGTIQQKHM